MSAARKFEPPLMLGIDVGTTGVRALMIDVQGRPVSKGIGRMPTVTPAAGRTEYPPDDLWRAVCGAVELCRSAAPAGLPDPAGIAVASVGEAGFPIDAEGRTLANAPAWFDARGAPDLEQVVERIGFERLLDTSGILPEPILGLCKLLWLRRERPEVFAKTVRWLNVADWVAYRMSGVAASELTLASRTLVLNVAERAWARDILAELEVEPDIFAPLRANGAALGPLLPAAAEEMGLAPGAVVGVGGHDHVCGAIAAGALKPGVLLDSFGTAEALFMTAEQPVAAAAMRGTGLVRGALGAGAPLTYVFGGLYAAGGAVEWFREALAGGRDHAALEAAAARVPARAGGALFLPHLRGRTTPQPDPAARGAFRGLSAATGFDELARAVFEGVAFTAAQLAEVMAAIPGVPAVEEIRMIGGGTRNALLTRIKASVYGRPLSVAPMEDGTARGAAVLAALAAGVFPDVAQAQAALGEDFASVEPDPDWVPLYAELAARYAAESVRD